jgi:hypothetical protein
MNRGEMIYGRGTGGRVSEERAIGREQVDAPWRGAGCAYGASERPAVLHSVPTYEKWMME